MNQHDPNQPYVTGRMNQPQPPRLDSQGFPIKPKRTGRTVAIVVASVFGGLVLIGALGSIGGDPKPAADPIPGVVSTTSAPTSAPTTAPTSEAPTVEATTPKPAAKTTAPPKTTAPAEKPMTRSQEQAVGKAESYLDYTAFSRKGLIQQLSSEYGEGFSKADATFAVDHLKVDWNEQAALKAKSYLEMQNFSRNGLIQQLESSYGEGFTHKQAVYGVTKAGL